MVRDFHEKYGCPVGKLFSGHCFDPNVLFLRTRLIVEETAEFTEAAQRQDVVAMVDALADLLYVVYGTAVVLGVDLEPVFRIVHESNMLKIPPGPDDKKVRKPPSWQPPDIAAELDRQLEAEGA